MCIACAKLRGTRAKAQIRAGFGPVTLANRDMGRGADERGARPLRHAMTDSGLRSDLSLLMLDGKETGIGARRWRIFGTSTRTATWQWRALED